MDPSERPAMSDTPTPLRDRLASMAHAFDDEGRKCAVRLLATEVGKVERDAVEAERLHIENLNLRRTIDRLRKAMRRMIDTVEGDRMKNAIQAGKDLL